MVVGGVVVINVPAPQDVVEYSCTSVNGSGSRTYNGASRAGKMY